ncbi:hypothetical protein F5883DRAFT_514729 [Diaporthe sp. PMI_573]|nr:hypothetical protein F5883DRAFT_514729 [Diaporthaceae sp. PMI_573]
MCITVQPICNACRATAGPMELHECIFRDCKYIEECTRFLASFERLNWNCDTPDCGLNNENIDKRLAEINQMLRMEVSLTIRPADGKSKAGNDPDTNISDSKAGLIQRGFDGDGTSHQHTTKGVIGLDALSTGTTHEKTPLSVTVPAAQIDIPPRPQSAPIPESTSHDQVIPENSVASDDNVASSDNTTAEENVTADNSVVANATLTTNDDDAANSSIQTEFDPDSVDLDTFPRCKSCFKGRRRCNGQTPCDKCQQRGSGRACRPVTVELLREYPDRAERILELAGRNGASA